MFFKLLTAALVAGVIVVGIPSSNGIALAAPTTTDTIWVNFNSPEEIPGRYFWNSSKLSHWDREYNVTPQKCDSERLDRKGGCSLSKPVKLVADLIAMNCQESNKEFCIRSFSVSESGSKLNLEPEGQLQGSTVSGVKSLGLPSGGTSGLWSGISAAGKKLTYLVAPKLQMVYTQESGKFLATTFSLEVVPYTELSKPGAEWLPNFESTTLPSGHTDAFSVPSGCEKALWISDGNCGISQKLNPNEVFDLSIQLPKSLKGWFQANLTSPEITIAQEKKFQTLFVSAAPGEYSVVTESEIPRASIASNPGLSYVGSYGTQIGGYGLSQYFALAIDWSVALAKHFKDVPTSIRHGWLLETMAISDSAANNYGTNSPLISRCVQSTKGVVGIVNSNAMAADPTPPKLLNGFLIYQLADFHYLPDGVTPKLGRYFMAIRDDFARCIYNSRSIPISASIQVVGDANATGVSRKIKGWHQLSVDGFTYSKKTIKIKFNRANR